MMHGTVTTVSRDAVPQQDGGLVYAMRVAIERSPLQVESKQVTLSPLMTVTVDIKPVGVGSSVLLPREYARAMT